VPAAQLPEIGPGLGFFMPRDVAVRTTNAPVLGSLRGLAAALEPGGYLLYTGQPWHPQLELIARTLTSHRGGQSWVMRRRSQAEMDQLAEHAGFAKLEQWIDAWGIFTVSLAKRR
jgi:hypothetical protein